jgi:hypothetical protein
MHQKNAGALISSAVSLRQDTPNWKFGSTPFDTVNTTPPNFEIGLYPKKHQWESEKKPSADSYKNHYSHQNFKSIISQKLGFHNRPLSFIKNIEYPQTE